MAEGWPAAVVVAAVAGQLAAAVVGALSWPLLPLTATLVVALSVLAVRAGPPLAARLRVVATGGALLTVLAALPFLVGGADADRLKGVLGLVLVGLQVTQALCWRERRELRTALVIAGALLVLAASYAPDVLVGAPLVLGWAALLVAVVRMSGSHVRDVLPATALAMALGLVVFLLVPVPAAAGVRSRLARLRHSTSDTQLTRGVLGADVFSGDVLDLRVRGDLPGDPLIAVDPSSPVLWRDAVFDTYDGTGWQRPGLHSGRRTSPLVLRRPTGAVRTDDVTVLSPYTGIVWSPGPVVRLDVDGLRFAALDRYGGVRLFSRAASYRVTSEVQPTDAAALRRTSGADERTPVWRALPASLPARVRDLAQQVAGAAPTRWDAAEAVADYLRAHETYALDSPVPGPGEDAVDRFLFTDHRGFCEQFASAEVVMLRALGIPARLSTGLAYGVEREGRRLYRVKDAHAWVELWVPGTGWVTSDPTAGSVLAATQDHRGWRARAGAAVTGLLHRLTRLPGGRALLGLLVLVATAGVGSLVRLGLLRPPTRRRRRLPGAPIGPALDAFRRLDARLGERRRRPAESLRDVGDRLGPDLREALLVVEQECYAAGRPDPTAAVAVMEAFRTG